MTARQESVPLLLGFAHELADLARAAILPHFRTPMAVENKASGGAFDPVTAADRGAEAAISRAIQARFPDHGLIGEEHGSHNPAARLTWVVDPIDGTRAFITGSPLWGTLIGLLDRGEPILGLMDQPFTRERYWSDETGARSRLACGAERAISTRSCGNLADAVLSTTHPDLFTAGAESEAFAALKAEARMTRYGGDCYSYAMLASGFVDLIVESGLKPFDIVALIPIIERAGGRITTWDGGPATSGGRIVAAGDPRLHAAALTMLEPYLAR